MRKGITIIAGIIVTSILVLIYMQGCESYTRNPANVLSARLLGDWRVKLSDRSDVPSNFVSITIDNGVLQDSTGAKHIFTLSTGDVPNYGPWMAFREEVTDVGWRDRIWLGMKAYESPEDDVLLIGFSGSTEGDVYPAEFVRR